MSDKYERNKEEFARVQKPHLRRARQGMKKVDRQYKEFVDAAKATDMLLPEERGFLEADGPMEQTWRFRQEDIAEAVDSGTANKQIELKLPELGPYTFDMLRNGRRMLIGGRKGHVALMDWRQGTLDCELFLNETVRAVQYFHSHQYFAVAQKKYTFIYDHTGLELHRLKQHLEHTALDFLPYHFLLVGLGLSGSLKYHDVLTGQLVLEHRTRLGPTQAMAQNPWNAVMHLGHTSGAVTLWCPTMGQPLVKMQSNRGPVRSLAVDREGKYMAVAGLDKAVRLWDLRKLEVLDTIHQPTPVRSAVISDTGLLLVAWGPHISVYKDVFKSAASENRLRAPYMSHQVPGLKIERLKYVPFEDILGYAHSTGVALAIVPGAGEANYDAMELNPYESVKQRQETEVRALLNKLAPDTILLDPSFIGTVDKKAKTVRVNAPDAAAEEAPKKDRRVKQADNIMDARRMRTERNLKMDEERQERMRLKDMGVPDAKEKLGPALGRFV